MILRLEVYLPFRGAKWWKGDEEVAPGTTVAELTRSLGLDGRPDLAVLVNGRHVDPFASLAEGDEVAYLRRSEGG